MKTTAWKKNCSVRTLQVAAEVCVLAMLLPMLQVCHAQQRPGGFSLPANTQAGTQAVPQLAVNLDLCALSYQLYHQSLCLPLDPWYDIFSRPGSHRRDNICLFSHEYARTLAAGARTQDSGFLGSRNDRYYGGPGAIRSWNRTNLRLDPILTNYKQIDPKLPVFSRDGAVFAALHAPSYLTSGIKVVEGIRHNPEPTRFPSHDVERFPIRQYPVGEDHLIAFEGGTGVVDGSAPSWSLMGFVLMRKTLTGYDAHIVFRGSRSGSNLAATVWKAQGEVGAPRGNADWVTDLRSKRQIKNPLISYVGQVTQGFSESLPTMLGPITACCKYLSENYPTPEHIYVTGHSLGAALASQFASAVLLGSYGDDLRNEVRAWPWDETTLISYAQPTPGDPTWAAEFNRVSPNSEHYWVKGDIVVEASSMAAVKWAIDDGLHCGIQHQLEEVANCSDNPHEVFVIRAALMRDHPSLFQQVGKTTSWAYYDSMSQLLAGEAKSYVYSGAAIPRIVTSENLRNILRNCDFSSQFSGWLENVYSKMLAERSSYRGIKLQSTRNRRRALVLQVVRQLRQAPARSHAQVLKGLTDGFEAIDDNLGLNDEEEWIYLGMILAAYQNTTITLAELDSQFSIAKCLRSKLNNE